MLVNFVCCTCCNRAGAATKQPTTSSKEPDGAIADEPATVFVEPTANAKEMPDLSADLSAVDEITAVLELEEMLAEKA